jgi:hypothetical protein
MVPRRCPCLRAITRTLIDSVSLPLPGVLKAWHTFAHDYAFREDEVAHATHGRRLYDTLKESCRIEDEEKLQVRLSV